MRRSSTTVSGPAMVLLRRYGEKLLQNSSDSTRPSAPATIRMTPTVLRLNPEVVTSTAKVTMAPTTNRKMLTPRLKAARLLQDASTVTVGRVLPAWLPSKTLCPPLLLRFPASRQGGVGAAGCGPHPNGRLRSAVSAACRQHLSPGGHH